MPSSLGDVVQARKRAPRVVSSCLRAVVLLCSRELVQIDVVISSLLALSEPQASACGLVVTFYRARGLKPTALTANQQHHVTQ